MTTPEHGFQFACRRKEHLKNDSCAVLKLPCLFIAVQNAEWQPCPKHGKFLASSIGTAEQTQRQSKCLWLLASFQILSLLGHLQPARPSLSHFVASCTTIFFSQFQEASNARTSRSVTCSSASSHPASLWHIGPFFGPDVDCCVKISFLTGADEDERTVGVGSCRVEFGEVA